MHLLKASTAATVLVGPVMDSAGAAVTSGVVIADFNLTKNGTTAAMASAATATHSHNGHWLIALTTGNTDTLGRATVTVNNATYAMPAARFTVLQATVFDALVTNAAGGANGLVLSDANNRVAVGKWLAQAVTLDGQNNPAVGVKSWNDGTVGALDTTAPPDAATIATAVWAAGTRTLSAFSFSVTVGTNNDKSGYLLGAAGLDAVPIETGVNARQAIQAVAAEAAGKLAVSGNTVTFAGIGVSTTRLTATTDTAGQRTVVTPSLTP